MNNKIKKLMTSSLVGMLMFSTAFPSFAGEYGSWKKLTSLPGVQFRTKCDDTTYTQDYYFVELYNGYNKNIRMEVELTQGHVQSYPSSNYHSVILIKPGNTHMTGGGHPFTLCGNSGVKIWYRNVKFCNANFQQCK
jgi:hypothetical protein